MLYVINLFSIYKWRLSIYGGESYVPELPMSTTKKTSAEMLFKYVNEILAIPSDTGYADSQTSSKNKGVPPSNATLQTIKDGYNQAETDRLIDYVFSVEKAITLIPDSTRGCVAASTSHDHNATTGILQILFYVFISCYSILLSMMR